MPLAPLSCYCYMQEKNRKLSIFSLSFLRWSLDAFRKKWDLIVVSPADNAYYRWLFVIAIAVLYNWFLVVAR